MRLIADPVATTLEVAPDALELSAEPKDSLRVIVRALDQGGFLLPFLDEAVHVSVTGPARLIGPAELVLKGGSTGFWLESTGGAGAIGLTVASRRFGTVTQTLAAR